jgi:DNA-binding transcriptional regulator LsrR (DeoR family)
MKKLALFKRIDWHISHKATGTPSQFAEKLDISLSSLHRYLSELKEEWNAPIAYSEIGATYYYTDSYSFEQELINNLKNF